MLNFISMCSVISSLVVVRVGCSSGRVICRNIWCCDRLSICVDFFREGLMLCRVVVIGR